MVEKYFLKIVGNVKSLYYICRMKTIEILKEKRKLLNVRQIEKEVGMPDTTLAVYLTKGYLPEKWEKPLSAWIKKNLK